MLFSLYRSLVLDFSFFFFNDTATTEIYTLSLHDALPISNVSGGLCTCTTSKPSLQKIHSEKKNDIAVRSEEHTSELQSRLHLVCRLLLEKKKSSCRIFRHSNQRTVYRPSCLACTRRSRCS